MKAKEYAARYKSANNKLTELTAIANDFIAEIRALAKVRGQSPYSMSGIVRELDNKWKAFIRHVGGEASGLGNDGFDRIVRRALPEFHEALREFRQEEARVAKRKKEIRDARN